MSHTYFIELLNNSGEVQSRQSCAVLPIHIGRAYYNDIILDDPHTAAEHAVVELNQDGILSIRNLHSQNGIRHKGKRADTFAVSGDDVFHLGHSHVRVRSSDYVVAPEIIDAVNHRWEGWPLAMAAVCIISLLAFGNAWLGDIDTTKIAPYVMSIFGWLGYSMLWAGLWALANRVFGGAAHFTRHLLILGCGLAILFAWGYIAIVLAYSFSWTLLTRYGTHIDIVIVATIIYYHLRQITPRKLGRLKIICAAFALLTSGLLTMKNFQDSDQYAEELYMHEILPPALRISRNHSLEEFNQDISQLKATIDAEREKANSETDNGKAAKAQPPLKK